VLFENIKINTEVSKSPVAPDKRLQEQAAAEKQLFQTVTDLIAETSGAELQTALTNFSGSLKGLFEEAQKLQTTADTVRALNQELFDRLQAVEDAISAKLIVVTMEGGDRISLEQLGPLLPRYREALLRITLMLQQIRQESEYLTPNGVANLAQLPDPLLMLFQDLSINLRSLLIADQDVAQQGEQLSERVMEYQKTVSAFLITSQNYLIRLELLKKNQEYALTLIRNVDTNVADATRDIETNTPQLLEEARNMILVLTMLIMVVLLIGWAIGRWMIRPLVNLSDSAARLADGDIECKVQETRYYDEIGTLSRAFTHLITYFQDMTKTATDISRGNLNLDVRPRSEKDALGTRFQQMIAYLKEIGNIAAQVAQGDLRHRVSLKSEHDQLGLAFMHMQEGLISLITGIRAGADYIFSTSTQITNTSSKNSEALEHIGNAAEVTSSAMREMNASAEEVRRNTEQLSSSVDETSTSISEMISSIKHVAENSRKLANFADNTSTTVGQIVRSLQQVGEQTERSKTLSEATAADAVLGQHAVEQMNEKMAAISTVTDNLSHIILRLENRSKEIGTILVVINEVADQTSLLALNASIIAAQAGVHGRGFAVVAQEIKELARRVATSTKEIAAIIKGVQRDSSDAAGAIAQGQQEVERGVAVANQAGGALNKIGQSAQNSSTVAAEIAVLVRQQTIDSIKVADSTKDVASMVSEISLATEEQERNSSRLYAVVENMQMLAAQVVRAMQEQQQSARHVTDFMEDVTSQVEQNIPTVQQLAQTANELAAQSDILKQQVERFILPETAGLTANPAAKLARKK